MSARTGPDSEDRQIPFGDLDGAGVCVAVIDSGVDPTHPWVGRVEGGVCLGLSADNQVVLSSDHSDDMGHGTSCAAQIRKIAPASEILSIKITDGTKSVSPDLLIAAIDWAVDRGVHVVSLSAGTDSRTRAAELADSCRRAAERGVVVVVSCSNDGHRSCPAGLDSVVTVGGDTSERGLYEFRCDPRERGKLVTNGGYQKVAWLEPRHIFLSGNSLATAKIAGIVALAVEHLGRLPLEELLDVLGCNAVNAEMSPPSCPAVAESRDRSGIEWIGRAAIYPFNKEAHSLIRFRDLLPFELVGVIDPIVKGCVGKDAGTLIGEKPAGLIVSSDLGATLEQADTLIISFAKTFGGLRKKDLHTSIAMQALALGKNVYSFEPFDSTNDGEVVMESIKLQKRVVWPEVHTEDLDELRQEFQVPIDYSAVPILGVFGTSSSQGKFTLQLLLRRLLQARGLKVAQIGTEHQSTLCGMEGCFPLGHVNSVQLHVSNWAEYLHLRYQQIVRDQGPDLIIVGSQGGLVPVGRLAFGEETKLARCLLFLMGIRADSYIVVVNHIDSDAVIQATLHALQVYGQGRTIALALSNVRKRITKSFGRVLITSEDVDPMEQKATTQRLEKRFQLPVFSILEEGERIADVVVRAYTPT